MKVMHKFRFYFVFASCCGVLFTALFALLSFLPNQALNHIVTDILIGPLFLAWWFWDNISEAPKDAIFWIFVFAQWFIVGLGIAFLFRLVRRRFHHDAAYSRIGGTFP